MDSRELCISLMKSDSEQEVIHLLTQEGYWQDEKYWRLLGDQESNYSVAGAQQSKADAALVEKIINSIDARLMGEVLKNNIDPQSKNAPVDIRTAVAQYIEKHPNPESESAGRVQDWPDSLRTKVANSIAVVATGAKPSVSKQYPCFSIIDQGEGQTPNEVPNTLMSIIKGNKAKIPFVQGKFNMGGTGVFRFCGKKNIQLVITRRDPSIVDNQRRSSDDDLWSFTIVRRDNAQGDERSSVYRYLAPHNAEDRPMKGGVIRFSSDTMPLMPTKGKAYSQDTEWGTLIKLYEYHASGFKSNMLMSDGLLSRLNIMLPDPALPIRLHECRDYRGHKGSFENTLTGLSVRLSDDKAENMEDNFPQSCSIVIDDEEIIATIYAFKKGRASAYKKSEGLIFVYNGQTHAVEGSVFFKSKKVGLSYLSSSLLIMLDCSKLSRRAFEDLFMNSRDRLSKDAELTQKIKEEVAYQLKHNTDLKTLQNKRREEEIASRISDSKPLEDILSQVFKQSPTLAALFLKGNRLSTAFKSKKVKENDKDFDGKLFPSFFRFKGKQFGEIFHKESHINMRCRLQFETDAENPYFDRHEQPGCFILERESDEGLITVSTRAINLSNGLATLTFPLPEAVTIGQTLKYRAITNDESQVEPFINKFDVKVLSKSITTGKQGKRRNPPDDELGDDRIQPSGIALPDTKWVPEEEWENMEPPFDKKTAMQVKCFIDENEDGDENARYDFFINKDNVFLNSEIKYGLDDPKLTEERYRVGMVLVGLAIINDQNKTNGNNGFDTENTNDIESKVMEVTKALAPFLIPMITSLGALNLPDDNEAEAA